MVHSAFRTETELEFSACMYSPLCRRNAKFKAAVAPWKKKKGKKWNSNSSMYAFSVLLSCGSLLLKIFLWNCSVLRVVLFAYSQISNHDIVMKHLELLKVEKLYFVCELNSRPSDVFRNKDFIFFEKKN